MSNDREERKPDRFTPEEPETEIRDDKEDILEETGSLEQSEVQEETIRKKTIRTTEKNRKMRTAILSPMRYRTIQELRVKQIKCLKI